MKTQSGTYRMAVNLPHMTKVVLTDDLQPEKDTNVEGIDGEVRALTTNPEAAR